MPNIIVSRPASAGARLFALSDDLVLVFAFLVAVVLVPVFSVTVAPLSDYINHLARMHVIAVGKTDPFLSAFYSVDWQLLPNLAMDLVVPSLARVVDVYTAGQLFLAATILMLVTGPMAVHYALFRRFDVWPLAAFLVVYNQVFLVGLMNYLIGAGLAMWGLAAWILLRERPMALRMLVSTTIVGLTYFCHLCAVGLYGLSIGAYELWLWYRRGPKLDRRFALDFAALALPALPIVPLLTASATWGLVAEYEWSAQGKLDAITMIFRTYSDTVDIGALVVAGAALVWAGRRSLIVFHPATPVLATIGFGVFLALPNMLFGSYMADQRIPIALFLMLLGCFRLQAADAPLRFAFVALVVALSIARTGEVTMQWRAMAHAHDEFRAVVDGLERGRTFLVAYADEPQLSALEQEAISHIASAAIIERSALVSTEFTVPGKQILRVRKAYADRVDTEDGFPPSVSQLLAAAFSDDGAPGRYWDQWQAKHDYLVVLYTERGHENPAPDLMTLVHDGAGFQLYRIER